MSSQKIAVIVAHPDDEVLAFGGVMCRHAEAGDEVSVLILASGLTARQDSAIPDTGELDTLRSQARAAGTVLGVARMEFADFPDNRMDSVALLDVVKAVDAFLERTQATIVYTHYEGDLNIDHGVVSRAVVTACRPLPGARVRKVYAGEVLSSSEYAVTQHRFRPTSYVGIAPYVARKVQALQCYASEIRDWPHPRSARAVELLAGLRGAESGLEAAEALLLLRDVTP